MFEQDPSGPSNNEQDLPDQARISLIFMTVFILNMIESIAEGLVLAEKSGLGTDNLHKFIEEIFPGPYTIYSRRMITGDYYDRKDVRNTSILLAQSRS